MTKNTAEKIGFGEFIALMALYIALTAMSIDAVLPALSLIGKDLHVASENQVQYIISALFLGFTCGQIIYGPLSDSFGRKNTIYVGIIIFIIGNLLSLSASDFSTMIVGRILQGFGAASPRIVGMAIIRDLYKGRDMARVMSFIMTIFIIVPVLAPSLGQLILLVSSWHIIFVIFLTAALIAAFWTYYHLPETLKRQDRRPFNIKTIVQDFCIVINNKTTVGYTICAGIIFGALIGYLNSSQQIFQNYFQIGNLFPVFFGISALAIGAATITNSMIVKRYGMKIICHYALIIMLSAAALFLPLTALQPHSTPLWQFMIYISITFFCVGLLFGNLNALAMEPMGHYAGMAAAIIGSLSSLISVTIGTLIGQAFNNTLIPTIGGFLLLATITFILQLRLKDASAKNESN